MKNLLTRTVSGIVYLILIVVSILLGPLVFGFLLLFFLILSLLEFHNLMAPTGSDLNKTILLIPAILYYLTGLLYTWDYLPLLSVVAGVLLFFLPFIFELFRKTENPVRGIGYNLFGLFYVMIPLLLLNFLFYPELDFSLPSKDLIFGFFIIIWINDTFAYLTGMLIGKHKFFERVSPKKTWEGTIGGVIFGIAGAWAISHYSTTFTPAEWIGFALTIIIFGTFGDLIESMIKRSLGVKDSGNIMPGHGGILDRLDSILIAAPFAFVYMVVLI